jgi:hypothetical protein
MYFEAGTVTSAPVSTPRARSRLKPRHEAEEAIALGRSLALGPVEVGHGLGGEVDVVGIVARDEVFQHLRERAFVFDPSAAAIASSSFAESAFAISICRTCFGSLPGAALPARNSSISCRVLKPSA